MALKVIGVYSSCTVRNEEKLQLDSVIATEMYKGPEWTSANPRSLVSPSRLERLAVLTKQFLDVPITKLELEYMAVTPGGVLNDRHYYQPKLVERNGITYLRRQVNEISIFSKEELDRLNKKFGTAVAGGHVGENMLVAGYDINDLSLNTILKIGNEVVLRVSARRSFCFKFIGAFYNKEYFTKVDYKNFDHNKIGLATQVIQSGIIKPGDTIEIIEPDRLVPLSLNQTKVNFELHHPTDPAVPPIPDTE